MSGLQLLRVGDVFAKDFRVLKPLKEGGMGAVYVVEQSSTRARRALKIRQPELVADPKLRARFQQEAQVGSLIHSEHVVQVLDAGVDAKTGMPWLIMELLEGVDLEQDLSEKKLDTKWLIYIFEQVCHALANAHSAGTVHRDLKPENIFLARTRRVGSGRMVKILDFGVAKIISESNAATAAVGTPLFMAPEQATSGRIGPPTDVWALGLIAFRVLTAMYFWKGAYSRAAVFDLASEMFRAPIPKGSARAAEYGLAGRFPVALDQWLATCLQRDPALRFQDAASTLTALKAAVAGPSDAALATTEPAPDRVALAPAPLAPEHPRLVPEAKSSKPRTSRYISRSWAASWPPL